jgi:hypothetical protein
MSRKSGAENTTTIFLQTSGQEHNQRVALPIEGPQGLEQLMSSKDSGKFLLPSEFYVVSREDNMRNLVDRNIRTIRDVFEEDPNKILVSVQIEEDQIDHLENGLTGRSRRLIPLLLLAELVKKINS